MKLLQQNKILSDFTTFKIGGRAKYFFEATTIEQMQEIISYASLHAIAYFILGKGSNILFDDKGFEGIVILNKISFFHKKDLSLLVGSGHSFAYLGRKASQLGLCGLEFASSIPGTVGGAIFMNAGANGQQVCETLQKVTVITKSADLLVLSKQDIEFGYRFSSFQKNKEAIVSGEFLCRNAEKKDFLKAKELRKNRVLTQPLREKSAGCIFKNPVDGPSAGALIDRCGLKGKRVGGAEISLKHANFIINKDNALAVDVLTLISEIQEKVLKITGVSLQTEVRYIPYKK